MFETVWGGWNEGLAEVLANQTNHLSCSLFSRSIDFKELSPEIGLHKGNTRLTESFIDMSVKS